MKVKSVTDKINESLAPDPRHDNIDENDYNSNARVVDFDEYEIPVSASGDFRRRNVKLLSDESSRYKGKIISRKDLNEGYDTDEEYREPDERTISESDDSSANTDICSEKGNTSMSSNESETDDENGSNNIQDVIVDKNRQNAEIRKGICVQNQLRIWERLLEMRIAIQKLLNKSNMLAVQSELTNDSARSYETMEGTFCLLRKLLNLKASLMSQFSELRSHMKRPLEATLSLNNGENGEPPLKVIAQELEDQHSLMRPYRNEVLLKWEDRTKLMSVGAGSKKKINGNIDVVRKIETALLNRDVLISKSRVLTNFNANIPSKGETLKEETQVENANVYDDSDFYHQQLRELIEYKTNCSANAAEVSKQISELQNLRQKMKKKVDTRSSKGRKIRYVVHNKLINFMAPNDTTSTNWPEESKNELYKSLFAT